MYYSVCDLRTLFRTYPCTIACVTLGHCSGHTHVVECDLRTLFRSYPCTIVCVTLGHCSGHNHVAECVRLGHGLENAHLVCTLSLLCAKSTPQFVNKTNNKKQNKKPLKNNLLCSLNTEKDFFFFCLSLLLF